MEHPKAEANDAEDDAMVDARDDQPSEEKGGKKMV